MARLARKSKTPDADQFQGDNAPTGGFGARERDQKMTGTQLTSVQSMIDRGVEPERAYDIVIGKANMSPNEHALTTGRGPSGRPAPRGSSPADLDSLDGAPAGDMPVDRRVDGGDSYTDAGFDTFTGKFLGPRPDPTAARRGDGMGEAEAYKGTIPYGAPGYDQQWSQTAQEKEDGEERVRRSGGGAVHLDELAHYNSKDRAVAAHEQAVASAKERNDRYAELRKKERKPKYNAQTGELLIDPSLERSGYRQVKGPDGKMRYRAKDEQGVDLPSMRDAREGIIRNPNGQVLVKMADGSDGYVDDAAREAGVGDGEYGPPVGGKQVGEWHGSTERNREDLIRRTAGKRGVPASVVREEVEAEEARGQYGYNSAAVWRPSLEKARDVSKRDEDERKARFKNKAMYGAAGQAMNLVNDTQFTNDPSQAGQWKNFMMAQALLNPEKGIVDPNAVTAANGERAFALASRMAGNAAFGGDAAGAAARNDARTDKAHDDFYKQDHSRGWMSGHDTPEQRDILIEDKYLQSQGKVSREAIAAHLNQKRGPVRQPGPPPPTTFAPADSGAGGSFM